MSVYYDSKRQQWRWQFDRKVKGQRQRLTKVLPKGWDRAKAERYDRERSEYYYSVLSGATQPTLSIAGAVSLYLEHRLPQLRDHHNIARELATLYEYIDGVALKDVGEIAKRFTKDSAETLQPATVRNRLAYLKAAVRYAYRHHRYGDQNYAEFITMPTVHNERQVYLRHADVKKLLAKIPDAESRAVFTLAYYTGYRWIREVLPRTPDDIELRSGVAWLKADLTKNGTPRTKPIHKEAMWALKHLPFTQHWRTYYKRFEGARKSLGLDHVRAHDLRHSLASEIISKGGTLSDVQGALHHDSVVSAKRYAHLHPERLESVLMGVGQKITRKKKAIP
jgi:integrase